MPPGTIKNEYSATCKNQSGLLSGRHFFACCGDCWMAIDRHFLNAKINEFDFSVGTQSLTDSHRSPLTSQDYANESLTIATQVTLSDLASCPRWDGNSGDPPISARRARKLADAAAAKLTICEKCNWHLIGSMSLVQLDIEDTADGRHWCWQATYFGGRVNSALDFRLCEIWILMNGSVINPEVVKK